MLTASWLAAAWGLYIEFNHARPRGVHACKVIA